VRRFAFRLPPEASAPSMMNQSAVESFLPIGFQQRRSGHGLVGRDVTGNKWPGSLANRDRKRGPKCYLILT
jgi:hypothetical protein